MFALIKQLHRTGLLTINGFWSLISALMTTGVNLMALLQIAAKLHPRRLAVIDEHAQLSYQELWVQTESLAIALQTKYRIQRRYKVAIACRNHNANIKAIFATARLGAHIYLLNPEMSADQMTTLIDRLQFDFCIYDESLSAVFTNAQWSQKSLPAYHSLVASIDQLSLMPLPHQIKLPKVPTGNIVVMTGGTTGQPKSAGRKPSIFNFLPPFLALLTQVQLDHYRTVYIATPIYHGFGVASLFMGIALGVTMYITAKFKAETACNLIAQEQIEVITLVPLILQRMLQFSPESLSALKCIVSGGALLNPTLAQGTLQRLGNARLFNMYGTSEAGFCIMATPKTLSQKPGSIGKSVQGVRSQVINESNQIVENNVIGRLCIRSAWTTNRQQWIETGDLAYQDVDGDLFLCGRVDDMIVSGGENVYPIELENILIQHPEIESVGVVGIPDHEFGQRLKAVIKRTENSLLDQPTLLMWLKPLVARHQVPAIIEFRAELPYTPLGKLDKKSLR